MDTPPLNALLATPLPDHDTPQEGGEPMPRPRLTGGNGCPDTDPLVGAAGMAAKRLLDLTAAVVGLAALAPFILLIALAIRLDSRGPVLFRQSRLGRRGRTFCIYKFRTMRAGAEGELKSLEARNEAARGVLFKMRHDPRVTRLGRFLRRTNLDELPQLLNVLKGEMSLVGPRPFQMRDCERLRTLDPHAFARRMTFPPGLTGAWQVGRSSPVDSEHLLDLDLDYVEHWSFGRDLAIIYRTVFIVLQGFVTRDADADAEAAPASAEAPEVNCSASTRGIGRAGVSAPSA